MNKNRKLINALLVSTMMLSGLSLDVSAADGKNVERIGGDTRIETAIKASDKAYPSKADAVVVAGWNGQVDALTGTLLASAKDAPLLMVSDQDDHIASVKNQIAKLEAKTVYLLGGEGAVSAKVANALDVAGVTVERVAGKGRFATAVEVAKESGTTSKHAFITADGRNGTKLADALSAGPAAGMNQSPILLTSKDSVPAETKTALTDMGITSVTVVGGTAAVSEEVLTELRAHVGEATRLSGTGRIETAMEIAKKYFPTAENAVIANDGRSTGENYADALVGGYFGAKMSAPVLLTQPGALSTDVKNYLGSNSSFAYVLGGTGVVKEDVVTEANTAIKENKEADLEVESVSAIAADTLQVTFNTAADVKNVDLAVTRAGNAVTGKFAWSKNNTVATFTADAKLRAGDYKVTATSGDAVTTGTVKVTDQKVEEIVLLDGEALTGNDRKEAYAFYDVYDQYGESVRGTTNITWTSSTGQPVKANRTTGQLTLAKKTNEEFRYKEVVYLTGVDAKTGKSVQAELEIGQPRALDTLEVAGFVKKGTSKIVEELPAGFKTQEYLMVFEALDQNGNVYYEDNIGKNDVTFVSDNPLLIEKVSETVQKLVIDGVNYGAVEITPGMNVDQGGEVNITAIANKTGNRTTKNIVVGYVAILSEFEMLEPTGIIAEGENVEIPFVAKANGQEITNFVTLARKAGINELKLNKPTVGNLVLEENDDGTARLMYKPGTVAWGVSETTDGIDRPVPLTAIVIGGNASSLMLSVEDKAMPVGIKEVNFEDTVVEGGESVIKLTGEESGVNKDSFTFVDQYGREMDEGPAKAFFQAAHAKDFKSGQELQGYDYSIKATYKGEDGIFTKDGADVKNNDAFEIKADGVLEFNAKNIVTTTAKSNMALDFEIVRYKNTNAKANFANSDFDFTPVSSKKNVPMTVVDITAVKNFEVKELPRLQVKTNNSPNATGASIGDGSVKALDMGMVSASATDGVTVVAGALTTPANKKVEVKGDYNGRSVNIPEIYLDVDSNQLVINGTTVDKLEEFVASTAAQDAAFAKATVGNVDFEAYRSGTAANGIAIKIEQGVATAENTNVPASVAYDPATDGTITVTLGATWDGAASTPASTPTVMTVKELKDLIASNDTVAALVKVTTDNLDSNGDANEVSPATGGLSGGLDAVDEGQRGFKWSDFYDVKKANFLRKDAEATVTATIKDLTGAVINTARRTVSLSDATPVATTIAGADKITVTPGKGVSLAATEIDVAEIRRAAGTADYTVKDQYGENFTADINFKAVNVKENEKGYVANNFKITKNDTTGLAIEGAERGDTFTLELRAGDAKKTVEVTVGADAYANVENSTNNYLNELLEVLEQQRKDLQK